MKVSGEPKDQNEYLSSAAQSKQIMVNAFGSTEWVAGSEGAVLAQEIRSVSFLSWE